MAMGMTADEYWNGDYSMLKYYRKANEIKLEMENQRLWLQGMYVYDAICCCVPVLRAFSKEKKPIPYPKERYAITDNQVKERQLRDEKKKFEEMKAKMIARFGMKSKKQIEKEQSKREAKKDG